MKINTNEELKDARDGCSANDQADELCVGAETWAIYYSGGQRGQMSRWPNDRGAVCWGGDSYYGEFYGDSLYLDDGESKVNLKGETEGVT